MPRLPAVPFQAYVMRIKPDHIYHCFVVMSVCKISIIIIYYDAPIEQVMVY